jgi:hypothetical protein
MGVYLTGVHLTVGVYVIGACLIDMYLIACTS